MYRKLQNGIDFEQALSTIYGVEMQLDNCILCRTRLLCGSNDPKHIEIVETNIVNADALRYNYRFIKGEHPYDSEIAEMKDEEVWGTFF